jgi:hypothetical protein
LPEPGDGTELPTSGNPGAEDVIASLEHKRVLMAELPPGQGRDTILRAIEELIAEYRADANSPVSSDP